MLPPTILSSPALLADLAPTGVFSVLAPRGNGCWVATGYRAVKNGVFLSRNPDSSYKRAQKRLYCALDTDTE